MAGKPSVTKMVIDATIKLSKIADTIDAFSPLRVVVDSLTTFSEYTGMNEYARELLLKRGGVGMRNIDQVVPMHLSERTAIKRMLASLLSRLRSSNTTILLTSELPEKGSRLSSDGVSEFLADGVILLYYWEIGSVEEHALKIRKMRYAAHEKNPLPYSFGSAGVEIIKEVL